jgi:hypothetical protein
MTRIAAIALVSATPTLAHDGVDLDPHVLHHGLLIACAMTLLASLTKRPSRATVRSRS